MSARYDPSIRSNPTISQLDLSERCDKASQSDNAKQSHALSEVNGKVKMKNVDDGDGSAAMSVANKKAIPQINPKPWSERSISKSNGAPANHSSLPDGLTKAHPKSRLLTAASLPLA